MFTNYFGTYFDGESARAIPVEVTFKAEDIYIFSIEKAVSKSILLHEITEIRAIGSNRIIVSFQHTNKEAVDITFENIVPDFYNRYPVAAKKSFVSKVAGVSNRAMALLLVGFIALMLGIYFFVVPFVGEMSTHLIRKEHEIKLGQTLYEGIIKSYKIDSAQTALVNAIADQIDFQSKYPIKITVVIHDEKNAFALPGGHIVIFSELLQKIQDPYELAALLAHEVSHINLQHSLRSIFRNLASYVFISVLLSDVNGITTVLLENANKFTTLSYSRSLEEDADKAGLEILYKNQLDPSGMLRLFKILMADSHHSEKHLEFLSTHPATQKRIQYLEQLISQKSHQIKTNESLEKLWQKREAMRNNP